MYVNAMTLGDAASDEALRLSLLRQVHDLNQSIAANMRIQPPTPASVNAVNVMLPVFKSKLAQLRAATAAANQSDATLSTFDSFVLSAGNYVAQVAQSAGTLVEGAAGFAGRTAAAAATPLILPLIGIAAALFIVGKGGLGNKVQLF